jgi:hypothetical protein
VACSGRGAVFVPSEAADRAEFIRVQCELAQVGPCPATIYRPIEHRAERGGKRYVVPPPTKPKKPCGWCPVCKLVARERELLGRNPQWRPACPACNGAGCYMEMGPSTFHRECPHCSGTGRVGELRRGLLEVVEVSRLADVLHQVLAVDCRTCRSKAGQPHNPYCSAIRSEKWEATQWAAGLMRDPFTRVVRRVMVGDRQPYRVAPDRENSWCYRFDKDWEAGMDGHLLPRVLAPHVKAPERINEGSANAEMIYYTTPDAAKEALGAAVADVLRALVAVSPS